ncbi:hypothetical protein M885DRAFT_525273, partial [Pelagophyceae sp. CCMP2097]
FGGPFFRRSLFSAVPFFDGPFFRRSLFSAVPFFGGPFFRRSLFRRSLFSAVPFFGGPFFRRSLLRRSLVDDSPRQLPPRSMETAPPPRGDSLKRLVGRQQTSRPSRIQKEPFESALFRGADSTGLARGRTRLGALPSGAVPRGLFPTALERFFSLPEVRAPSRDGRRFGHCFEGAFVSGGPFSKGPFSSVYTERRIPRREGAFSRFRFFEMPSE